MKRTIATAEGQREMTDEEQADFEAEIAERASRQPALTVADVLKDADPVKLAQLLEREGAIQAKVRP